MLNTVIVNYGMGNLRSIQHKLSKLGVKAIISSSSDEIKRANLLILPGVGHFAKGMENIKKYGLYNILNKKVLEDKTPILGICLGMQLFSKWSEEGKTDGFGWINAETKLFRFNNNITKVPHIGWTTIKPRRKNQILNGINPDQRFYFVHSYYVICNEQKDVLTTSTYGNIEFVSSVKKDHIFGTQFHPEKSHQKGMGIIANFISLYHTLT